MSTAKSMIRNYISSVYYVLQQSSLWVVGITVLFVFVIVFTVEFGLKKAKRFQKIKKAEEEFDLQDTDESIPNLYELDKDDEDRIMGEWSTDEYGLN